MKRFLRIYALFAIICAIAALITSKREALMLGFDAKMPSWQWRVILFVFLFLVFCICAKCFVMWLNTIKQTFLRKVESTESVKVNCDAYPKNDGVFCECVRKDDWDGALADLEKAKRKKLILREEYALIKAVVLYQMALKEEKNGNIHAYPRHLVLANELAPSFVPAALALADFYLKEGQKIKAAKILKDVWRKNPTFDVAKAYLALYPDDTAVERAQRMESFALYNAKLPGLNSFIKAGLNMKAKLYDKAKAELDLFLIKNPATKKVASLMAIYEEKVLHNQDSALNWKKRAKKSGRECLWVCKYCGKKSTKWHIFCNECYHFNPFEWKLCVARKRGRERRK